MQYVYKNVIFIFMLINKYRYLKAFDPKWLNSISNITRVNSLWLECFHLLIMLCILEYDWTTKNIYEGESMNLTSKNILF